MPLSDAVPDDVTATLKWAPHVNTCRVYDRSIFTDETAITTPPIVSPINFPVRVTLDEVTVYGKKYNATLVDPTGLTNNAGIWYADVIVNGDPDLTPSGVLVQISHPNWIAPETRRVPAGGGAKLLWTSLELVDFPAAPIQAIFVGGGAVTGDVDGGLITDGAMLAGPDGGVI